MDEATIKAFQGALGKWLWNHDFNDFCKATGFTGGYAEDKWLRIKDAGNALGSFDAATLAKILAS